MDLKYEPVSEPLHFSVKKLGYRLHGLDREDQDRAPPVRPDFERRPFLPLFQGLGFGV